MKISQIYLMVKIYQLSVFTIYDLPSVTYQCLSCLTIISSLLGRIIHIVQHIGERNVVINGKDVFSNTCRQSMCHNVKFVILWLFLLMHIQLCAKVVGTPFFGVNLVIDIFVNSFMHYLVNTKNILDFRTLCVQKNIWI